MPRILPLEKILAYFQVVDAVLSAISVMAFIYCAWNEQWLVASLWLASGIISGFAARMQPVKRIIRRFIH